jgi:hypothetical protein
MAGKTTKPAKSDWRNLICQVTRNPNWRRLLSWVTRLKRDRLSGATETRDALLDDLVRDLYDAGIVYHFDW